MLGKSARESSSTSSAAFGDKTHLPGFVDSNSEQAVVQKDAVQMTGSMTDLENAISLDQRDHALHPVFPAIKGNTRRHEVIGESELVIKQFEKVSQKCFHEKHIVIARGVDVPLARA